MHELDILWRLGLTLALSSAIGIEREIRQKAAGLRTYSLVGVGSAVFMLVSTYGFGDVMGNSHVALDPSRVAAQIVSGIGFIGGGIIFVRRDAVRGLTTAAGVWVTAGIGMACGGDLPIVAVAATVVYFIVAYGYPPLVRRLPRSRWARSDLRLVYRDGHGVLREALEECASRGFSIADLSIDNDGNGNGNGNRNGNGNGNGRHGSEVTVNVELRGQGSITQLASDLHELGGVLDVRVGEGTDYGD